MNNHPSKLTRCCAHCGQRFIVNPRVGRLHRFCAKPDCKRASRIRARKKWIKKNGGRKYYVGEDNTDRVRTWRQEHPHYWRRPTRVQRHKRNGFILTKRLSAALRYVALQDMIDTHLALQIGIISHLSGTALQDTIAKELKRLMLRGHAILRGKQP